VYCSGDKGTVERKNRVLREYLPKGTNFDLIGETELAMIEKEINEPKVAKQTR
jgi:IS30 family transposase